MIQNQFFWSRGECYRLVWRDHLRRQGFNMIIILILDAHSEWSTDITQNWIHERLPISRISRSAVCILEEYIRFGWCAWWVCLIVCTEVEDEAVSEDYLKTRWASLLWNINGQRKIHMMQWNLRCKEEEAAETVSSGAKILWTTNAHNIEILKEYIHNSHKHRW